jgi:hypothetical protein
LQFLQRRAVCVSTGVCVAANPAPAACRLPLFSRHFAGAMAHKFPDTLKLVAVKAVTVRAAQPLSHWPAHARAICAATATPPL